MAWILSEVVISCYPTRATICSNVSMEVTLNRYHNFRRELSEVLVDISKTCTLILNTYLRCMASNSKHTKTPVTDSTEHKQDWKIKACLFVLEISFLLCKPKIHYHIYKNMKVVHFPFLLNTMHIKTQTSRILVPLVKMKILHVDHKIYVRASWQETIIFITSLSGSFCTLCR